MHECTTLHISGNRFVCIAGFGSGVFAELHLQGKILEMLDLHKTCVNFHIHTRRVKHFYSFWLSASNFVFPIHESFNEMRFVDWIIVLFVVQHLLKWCKVREKFGYYMMLKKTWTLFKEWEILNGMYWKNFPKSVSVGFVSYLLQKQEQCKQIVETSLKHQNTA